MARGDGSGIKGRVVPCGIVLERPAPCAVAPKPAGTVVVGRQRPTSCGARKSAPTARSASHWTPGATGSKRAPTTRPASARTRRCPMANGPPSPWLRAGSRHRADAELQASAFALSLVDLFLADRLGVEPRRCLRDLSRKPRDNPHRHLPLPPFAFEPEENQTLVSGYSPFQTFRAWAERPPRRYPQLRNTRPVTPAPVPSDRDRLAAGGGGWDGAREATRAACRSCGVAIRLLRRGALVVLLGRALGYLGARRFYPTHERHDMTATNALRSSCAVAVALLASVLLPAVAAARPYTVRTLTAASGPSPFAAGCPGAFHDEDKVDRPRDRARDRGQPEEPAQHRRDLEAGHLGGLQRPRRRRRLLARRRQDVATDTIPGLTRCTGGTRRHRQRPWVSAGGDGTVYFGGQAG